jgi:hypothetical protein
VRLPISLLAFACAGAVATADREAALLSVAPPPTGRTCGVAAVPNVLPGAATLVDSVGLISGARAATGGPAAFVLLSLRFDDHGRSLWTRVIETNLGEAQREAIERLVAQSLLPQADGPSWSVRLKIEITGAPTLRVGRSEICPAAPRPGEIDVTSRRITTGVASGSPRFSLLVDHAGRVLQIRLLEGSNDKDVDRAFEQSLRALHFRPTLIDGEPVSAWTEWPPLASR